MTRMAECHPDRPSRARGLCNACYRSPTPAKCHPDRPLRARGLCNSCYQNPRLAECHPDKPHLARGMCGSCYWKLQSPGPRPPRMAECHPERRHKGLGMCRYCLRKNTPGFPEKNRASASAWKLKNPLRWEETNRRSRLIRIFGITLEEYEAMAARQNHVCAICGRGATKRRLAVDHDHKTGRVRGLLCAACNISLGGFKDDPDILRRAIEYLERHA